jgi:hypothetical protein
MQGTHAAGPDRGRSGTGGGRRGSAAHGRGRGRAAWSAAARGVVRGAARRGAQHAARSARAARAPRRGRRPARPARGAADRADRAAATPLTIPLAGRQLELARRAVLLLPGALLPPLVPAICGDARDRGAGAGSGAARARGAPVGAPRAGGRSLEREARPAWPARPHRPRPLTVEALLEEDLGLGRRGQQAQQQERCGARARHGPFTRGRLISRPRSGLGKKGGCLETIGPIGGRADGGRPRAAVQLPPTRSAPGTVRRRAGGQPGARWRAAARGPGGEVCAAAVGGPLRSHHAAPPAAGGARGSWLLQGGEKL